MKDTRWSFAARLLLFELPVAAGGLVALIVATRGQPAAIGLVAHLLGVPMALLAIVVGLRRGVADGWLEAIVGAFGLSLAAAVLLVAPLALVAAHIAQRDDPTLGWIAAALVWAHVRLYLHLLADTEPESPVSARVLAGLLTLSVMGCVVHWPLMMIDAFLNL